VAELTLRERLQPSLFDRLIDDERVLMVFELSVQHETLDHWRLTARDIEAAIAAQCAVADVTATAESPSVLQIRCSVPAGRMSLSELKAVRLTSAGREAAGQEREVLLADIAAITAHRTLNRAPEPADKRYATARRLRAYVCRDIARLLNSTSIDATVDLGSASYVKQSVLNYGMQTPSGKSVSAIDRSTMARMLETAVRTYEPRLRKVRVSPDEGAPGSDPHEIAFRIDCELWNQPAPNQLVLRTRINTESGRAHVDDSGGAGAWIPD
jgi:type VI secretion system protein ImpF